MGTKAKKKHTIKQYGKGVKGWIQRRFKGRHRILVEMTHINGTVTHYMIIKDTNKFKLDGNTYIIDEDQKCYDNGSKCYMFRYHEGFALPYFNTISSHELKNAAVSKENPKMKTAFSPSVLTDVLRMEYAKGVIQGGEVSDTLKRIMFVLILAVLIGGVNLLGSAITQQWFG